MARFEMLAIAIVGASMWAPLALGAEPAKKDASAGPGACSRMRCAAGTRCVNSEDGKTGKCVALRVKCDPKCVAKTEKCELKQVICIKAPCSPVPTCVKRGKTSNPCATNPCTKTGQTCVVQTSIPPKAACIDTSALPTVDDK